MNIKTEVKSEMDNHYENLLVSVPLKNPTWLHEGNFHNCFKMGNNQTLSQRYETENLLFVSSPRASALVISEWTLTDCCRVVNHSLNEKAEGIAAIIREAGCRIPRESISTGEETSRTHTDICCVASPVHTLANITVLCQGGGRTKSSISKLSTSDCD